MFRVVLVSSIVACAQAWGQGQDSQPYERDLQVVAQMLSGGFDSSNQSYFDRRGDRDVKHRRLHVDVDRLVADELGEYVFAVSSYWDGDESLNAGDQLWILSADAGAEAVRMRVWPFDAPVQADALTDGMLADRAACDLFWRREAAQFRATSGNCGDGLPDAMVLSDKQLWATWGGGADNDYRMHRVREFECYVDIPGVGGGRPEPYDRYDGFKIHDQGGSFWFTSKEGREIGVSLLLVDWPINNYEGVFTRDSFVIYAGENVGGQRKELGYAFTVPEADRIGINLKWMLASCFMLSNRFATPAM